MLQWYVKVPVELKVTEKDCPGERIPLSQMPGVSEVVVCWVLSLFSQVTFVPCATMMGCTVPNREFAITITHGFPQLVAVVLGGGAPPPDPEPPP